MLLNHHRLLLTSAAHALVSHVQAALSTAYPHGAIPAPYGPPLIPLDTGTRATQGLSPIFPAEFMDGWQLRTVLHADQPAVRVAYSKADIKTGPLWVQRYRQVLLAAGFGCSPLLTHRPPEQPANPSDYPYKRSAEVIYDSSDPPDSWDGLSFYVTAAPPIAGRRMPRQLDFYA